MAGGKLSPRQKMINMMYLVLTAMLALNVSKDILKALTKLEDSLSQTIATVENKNADVYKTFDNAAKDNPDKALKWKDKPYEVKAVSDQVFSYIHDMKDSLVSVSGGYDEETGAPKALDAKSQPAAYLLAEQGPKKATDLKVKLENLYDTHLNYNNVIYGHGATYWIGTTSDIIKNLSSAALLGMIPFSSIADLGNASLRLKSIGKPFLESNLAPIQGLLQGRGNKEIREIADSINVGMEGLISGAQSSMLGGDALSGKGSNYVSAVMRYS